MAFLLYATLAIVYWLLPIAGAPGRTLIAADDIDASAFMWMFAWWPHALGHGINPFVTHAIFVPDGYNLAWASSMPGPSLLLAPVTLGAGPAWTWNALALLAPALSAWTAYLLCHRVSARVAPSLVGGYVFGFSPYVLGHIAGAPNLAMVALLPLAVLLVVRHVEGDLRDRWFVVAMAAVLTAQFLTWVETLAVASLFGAVALLTAYVLLPDRRAALRRTVVLLAGALMATGVLVSPFLHAFLFEPHTVPEQALKNYPADLLSWVVPASFQALATGHTRAGAPAYATGYAYLGLPLVLLLAVFAWRYRERPVVRVLAVCFAVAAVASLGEALQVHGHNTGIPLPWAALAHLPGLRYAIPVRFGVFFLLPAAVAVSLWLSWARGWAPWALAALAVAFLVPDIGNALWRTPLTNPPFFDHGASRAVIRTSDRVLAVPPWAESMRWQAREGYRFGLAGGYLGAFPEGYASDPTFQSVLSGRLSRGYAAQLSRFVRVKGVTAIVVDERRPGPWRRLFGTLGVRPVRTKGVLVYRLRPRPLVQPRPAAVR